jgi:hypothetical protein
MIFFAYSFGAMRQLTNILLCSPFLDNGYMSGFHFQEVTSFLLHKREHLVVGAGHAYQSVKAILLQNL